MKTFQFILVKKFRVADGQVGVGQRRFPLPLDFLVQRPAPVQQEALVDKVDWNCDDERQEKEREEREREEREKEEKEGEEREREEREIEERERWRRERDGGEREMV